MTKIDELMRLATALPVAVMAPKEVYIAAVEELRSALEAALRPREQNWVDLQKEADAIVRKKPTFKRFISGTPLENDIACWMADFALDHTAPPAQPDVKPGGEPVAYVGGERRGWTYIEGRVKLAHGTPLYTAPPAQPDVKPGVEPIGYRYKYLNFMGEEVWSFNFPRSGRVLETVPVYTAPPAQTPPRLTEYDIVLLKQPIRGTLDVQFVVFARAIESAVRKQAGWE